MKRKLVPGRNGSLRLPFALVLLLLSVLVLLRFGHGCSGIPVCRGMDVMMLWAWVLAFLPILKYNKKSTRDFSREYGFRHSFGNVKRRKMWCQKRDRYLAIAVVVVVVVVARPR